MSEDLYYDCHVFVCTNKRDDDHPRGSCSASGSVDLRDYMKAEAKKRGFKKVRINSAGCLDRCELGPTMVIYPEGVWYGPKTREDIDDILDQHLGQGARVERLILKVDDQ